MELCYDGALVMPSNYVVMSEEEMTYVEGGGKITVKGSASTAKKLARGGVTLIAATISGFFGGPVLVTVINAGLARFIYNSIINICGVKYKAFKFSWSSRLIRRSYTMNLNRYV